MHGQQHHCHPESANLQSAENRTGRCTDRTETHQRRNPATKGNGVSTISAAFGSGLIRRGSKGNYVKNVQLCLCARGINVDVDGIFGAKTEEAVIRDNH